MWKDFFLKGTIVIASITAATFWFWSSSVEIPNQMDGFIAGLHKASQLSAYAAIAAGVAALFEAFRFIREWFPTRSD